MEKIIIFGDSLSYVTTILLEATLKEIEKRDDAEVIAVCDTSGKDPKNFIVTAIRKITANFLKWLFNEEYRFSLEKNRLMNLYIVARRFGLNVIVPNDRNINHPEFIRLLKTELKPTICLSYFCPQIFRKELLDIFDWAANYHNSLLPEYGGIGATPWSLYKGESKSGFTFHLIDEKIDRGNILYQEAIPVTPKTFLPDLEYDKTSGAADAITLVLKMMSNRDKGRPQHGTGSYYGWKEYKNITEIENPQTFSFSELEKRLSAFRVLSIKIGDRVYDVTKLKKMDSSYKNKSQNRGLCFITSDNITVKPSRFLFLPLSLYALYGLIKN